MENAQYLITPITRFEIIINMMFAERCTFIPITIISTRLTVGHNYIEFREEVVQLLFLIEYKSKIPPNLLFYLFNNYVMFQKPGRRCNVLWFLCKYYKSKILMKIILMACVESGY